MSSFFLADPNTAMEENFNAFVQRSKKLCQAWEVTLLLMNNVPSPMKNKTDFNETKEGTFNDRVKLGMKTMFNSSVYEGKINGKDYDKADAKVQIHKICFVLFFCLYRWYYYYYY